MIVLIGVYPKDKKTYVHTKPNVYNSFTHNCQSLEATKMTISGLLDKLWYIHTTDYYSELKRNELIKTCKDMRET